MLKDIHHVQWTGRQAVIALPEHIDVSNAWPRGLARATVAAKQAHDGQELLDSITTSLYNAGLSLQAVADLPHDEVGKRIAEALQHLDDTIREIRDHAFTTRDQSQIELPAGDQYVDQAVSQRARCPAVTTGSQPPSGTDARTRGARVRETVER